VRPYGEGFEEEEAAGEQGALDFGEGGAVEIVEAEDQIEGCGGEGRGFEIGFGEEEAGEAVGEGGERMAGRGDWSAAPSFFRAGPSFLRAGRSGCATWAACRAWRDRFRRLYGREGMAA